MRFWNYVKEEGGDTELRLEGAIAQESWFKDDVTPKAFRAELEAHPGPLTVWINSPGGDVFAASQIYTMLMERKGDITVKIDGIAASAASVIAMAGTTVLMAPTAYMMVHNPLTFAWGDAEEMRAVAELLDEVKGGIISAYELKTGHSAEEIADLMDQETWMNARSALERGFCDGILYADGQEGQEPEEMQNGRGAYAPAASLYSPVEMRRAYARMQNNGPTPDGDPGNEERERARDALSKYICQIELEGMCYED